MIHSRRLRAVPTLATLGWVLTTAGPIAAKTITYTPQQVYYTYCFSHPPAARIASGDTVVTKTRDASNDLIQPTDKTTGKLDLSRANPQTGPFFVEGAEPGDTLKVHIDKITLNRNWGWGEPCRTSERWRPSTRP
jgi:amidase